MGYHLLSTRANIVGQDTPFNFFGYNPSLPAAIILCIAFGLTTLICITNVWRHRKQTTGHFIFIFIFCPFAKCIGYALRSVASGDPTNFNLYISSQFFLFMTPQICAAAAYLTYAGLVHFIDEKFTLIKARNVAIIFLGLDAFATAIQGGGAGQLFGANADTWKIGAGLCLAGMLVEFISFNAFSIVVIIFGCRYRANKETIQDPDYKIPIVNKILGALYINLAGQFVRTNFRLQEFCRLIVGFHITPEVYFYLFDGLPILACTLAFSILLPWQLDYKRAVGDVLEKIEWGLLYPVVWPIKNLIRKKREKKAEKARLALGEDPPVESNLHELRQLPK